MTAKRSEAAAQAFQDILSAVDPNRPVRISIVSAAITFEKHE
jgi:hypothetical protein